MIKRKQIRSKQKQKATCKHIIKRGKRKGEVCGKNLLASMLIYVTVPHITNNI